MSVLHHLINCMCSRGEPYSNERGDGGRFPFGRHCVSHRKVKFGVALSHVFTPCEGVQQLSQMYPRNTHRLIFTSDLMLPSSKSYHPAASAVVPSSNRPTGATATDEDDEAETTAITGPPMVSSPSNKRLFVALPLPLWELLTYLARTGVYCSDLFRRPGNIQHIKTIIQAMQRGQCVAWSDFNVYTLANVVKRFLLEMPGGLFGMKGELQLLELVDGQGQLEDEWRIQVFLRLLNSLSLGAWQLIVLIFGIWFRMIVTACGDTSHPVNVHFQRMATSGATASASTRASSDDLDEITVAAVDAVEEPSTVSTPPVGLLATIAPERYIIVAEGVAKSVCGSVFHTCRESAMRVHLASQVLQLLILSFPRLGTEAVDFYHLATDSHVPLPTLDVLSPQKRASLVRRASRFALGTLSGAMSRKRSARLRSGGAHPAAPSQGVGKDSKETVKPLGSHEPSSVSMDNLPPTPGVANEGGAVDGTTYPVTVGPLSATRAHHLALFPPSLVTPGPPPLAQSTSVALNMPVLPRVIVTSAATGVTTKMDNPIGNSQAHGLFLAIAATDDTVTKRQSAPPLSTASAQISVLGSTLHRDRFNSIRRRQLELQRKRSEWFLAAPQRPTILSSAISTTSFRSEYLDDMLAPSGTAMLTQGKDEKVPLCESRQSAMIQRGQHHHHLTAVSGPDLMLHSGCSSSYLFCYSPHSLASGGVVGEQGIILGGSSARDLSSVAASSSCMVWDERGDDDEDDEEEEYNPRRHSNSTAPTHPAEEVVSAAAASVTTPTATTEPMSRRQLASRRLSENV